MMKKSFILSLLFLLLMCSCREWKPYDLTVCENEDFIYHIYEPYGTEQYKTYLVGLTEIGMSKKEIIIPEYIDGYKIDGLGYERPKGGKLPLLGGMQAGNETVYFDFRNSEKKIYFESAYFLFGDETFKVINVENVEFLSWVYPLNIIDLFVGNFTWGYNVYDKYVLKSGYPFSSNHKIANVTYLYNYENSSNDDYYWIDNYDNTLISFIPPNPKREGYIFVGWYKEAECINEWDFSNDKTNDEMKYIQGSKYNEYTGIYLYAKWEKE